MTEDQNPGANPEEQAQILFGIHVLFTADGNFAMNVTGQPNLGEIYMLLARAQKTVEARMTAETVAQVLEHNQSQRRIITPRS